jgi:hypothetical protein
MQFFEDLVVIVAGGVVAYYGTLVVVLAFFAVRDEYRLAQRRKLYRSNPDAYCALGHFHASRLEAEWCEAAHGVGDQ